MQKSDRFVVTPVIEMGANRNERAVDVEGSGVDYDRKMSFAQWTRLEFKNCNFQCQKC